MTDLEPSLLEKTDQKAESASEDSIELISDEFLSKLNT